MTCHHSSNVSDGCFLEDGNFSVAPKFMPTDLSRAFQYQVLKMLKKEGRINDAIIENMLSWHHSGFQVYIGDRIYPFLYPFFYFISTRDSNCKTIIEIKLSDAPVAGNDYYSCKVTDVYDLNNATSITTQCMAPLHPCHCRVKTSGLTVHPLHLKGMMMCFKKTATPV